MIGIFDSGLGGLTVVRELERRMPGRDFVYLGDNARAPYGSKSPEAIQRYAAEDARFLVAKGATIIVIACNTVSAVAISAVRAAVSVPVFEVVTPAVSRAAALTDGRVGVIGTRATVGSGIYPRLMEDASPRTRMYGQACPLFVPLVEEDWVDRPETVAIVRAYVEPLAKDRIDTLILGCTHYPFLRAHIEAALPAGVRIVDPAAETVAELARHLAEHPALDASLGSNGSATFFVTDPTSQAEAVASRWLGRRITLERATLK